MAGGGMTIIIASADEARRILLSDESARIDGLISINDPGEPPPSAVVLANRRIVLHFHDTSQHHDEPGLCGLKPPHPADTRRIIDFAATFGDDATLLIHCGHGISRSAAAALTVLASRVEPSHPAARKVICDLLAIKRGLMPNQAMVHYADEALGWSGKLFAAYRLAFKAGSAIWTPT